MSAHSKKIIDSIVSNDTQSFNSFLEVEEDIKTSYSSIINALIFNERADLMIALFNKYPEFALAKNSKGYNIAHILAIKNSQWTVPVLSSFDDEVFKQLNNEGFTPFCTACAKSTDQLWKTFLNHPTTKIDAKISNSLGVNHLYLAVYSNSEEKVYDLMEKGVSKSQVSSVMDIALEKKNWNIIGALSNSLDIIPSKLILTATKDYPNSESAMQSFIDNKNLQDKIFPLSQENKLPVWSYFFYYVSWDFIKKNQDFLRERFIPDLNKDSSLESVIYSCFLGKRDTLNKIDWLFENTRMKWVSLDESVVSNCCTFNKSLPKGFASYFDKLSEGELKTIVHKNRNWLKDASREDYKVINLALLAKGLPQFAANLGEITRGFNSKFKGFSSDNKDEAVPIQFVVNSMIEKIPLPVIKDNMFILSKTCSDFKIVADRLYEPFVEDLKKSNNPLDILNSFELSEQKRLLMKVTVFTLLSEDSSETSNNVLESFKEHPYYKKSVIQCIEKALSDSKTNKKSKLKIQNFDFPGRWDISWEQSDETLCLPILLNFISACNYSKDSFKTLDKINKESWVVIEKGVVSNKQRFNHKDMANSLNLKTGVNLDFLKAIEENALDNTKNSVFGYVLALGISNVEDKAYEYALEQIKKLDGEVIKRIVQDFSHSNMATSDGIFELLKIAKSKDLDLPSIYWQNLSNIKPDFYINTLSQLNDFSYFFDYLSLGNDIDTFSSVWSNKTPEFETYLKNSGSEAWRKRACDFQYKDALFIGMYVLTIDNKEIENDYFDYFKSLSEKAFKEVKNSVDSLSKELQAKTIVLFLSDKNVTSEQMLSLLETDGMRNFSSSDWYEQHRSISLGDILHKNMVATSDSQKDDLNGDFKL